MFQAEKLRLKKKEAQNNELIGQISKKLKQQEKKSSDESRIAIELRRRYDILKRQCEAMQKEKGETH